MGLHLSGVPGEQRPGTRGHAHDHDARRPLRRGAGRRLLAGYGRGAHRRVHRAGWRERRWPAVLLPRTGPGLRGQFADAVHHRRHTGGQLGEHPVRRYDQPEDRLQVVRVHRQPGAGAGVHAPGFHHAAQRASGAGGAGRAQRDSHLRRGRRPVLSSQSIQGRTQPRRRECGG